ncbi:MAG: sigma-54-dependent Fis family transcriptional regulator [Candidatus Riflebacteria bacterium]|nr:sigma-54-dependent Fis family transcriptional regulator [Candidatus Riflebacteria bacterium]
MTFKNHNILIVDDEKAILFSLKAALAKEGYRIKTCDTPEEALKTVEPGVFQVIISDYNMPGMNGMELMEKIRQIDKEAVFILMTAYGSEKLAIEAVKAGAYDYFSKPFDIDEMRLIVAKACERFNLAYEKKNLQERLQKEQEENRLIGVSEQMERVKNMISTVAKSDITVLIQGESGTGKELVADAIQRQSLRASGPYVALNCAALPENLIESELFGYEKGAFTGANTTKRGKFELANRGTILLDEIGDMALATQAKVLRVIQEKEVERLGGSKPIKVDVRILAATHKNLKQLIEQGLFREDLFYRINVVNIPVAPLRERKADLKPLIEHFIAIASKKTNKNIKGVSEKAMEILENYDWPGNVRQLQNIIEGAAVFMKDDIIEVSNLPPELRKPQGEEETGERNACSEIIERIKGGEALDAVLSDLEKQVIEAALKANDSNQSKTAEMLGIKRGTLQYKMKNHNL